MIARIWHWLFHSCVHKWVTIEVRELRGFGGERGSRYILRCEHCGNIKKKDLI